MEAQLLFEKAGLPNFLVKGGEAMLNTNHQEVVLDNKTKLILSPNNYLASGGEGTIYRVKNIVIKIYKDQQRMRKRNFDQKIKKLSQLSHPFIVAPQGLVFNKRRQAIGFYMPLVSGEPLPRVFTNAFWQRTGFTPQLAQLLVNGMYETVKAAHKYGAIMVDANELNWLVKFKNKTPEPRVIDVDSWAIGKWRPTVIMPSIRDWHTKEFNQLTDWFSWGIITFQVFVGIHPYKGQLAGFGKNDLVKRMKANLSVFTPGVRLNKAVRDFSVIPGPLFDWYWSVFQEGERSCPPSPLKKQKPSRAARITYLAVKSQGKLIFDKLYGGPDKAKKIFPAGVVWLQSGKLLDLERRKIIGQTKSRQAKIIRLTGGWLKAEKSKQKWRFFYIQASNLKVKEIKPSLEIKNLWLADNRFFTVSDKALRELVFNDLGPGFLTIGKSWGIAANTAWFKGVGVEDALGAKYLILPFSQSACAIVRVPQIDCLEIVNAQAGNRFVALVGLDKKGNYQKLEFSFSSDYQNYQFCQTTVDNAELNLAILPRGVCAAINQDGELVVFVPTSKAKNKIQDKNIDTRTRLFAWNNKVVCLKDGQIWQIRMS